MCAATVETILNAIKQVLEKCKVLVIYTVHFGLGSDGASTMVCHYHSVWSRMHEQTPILHSHAMHLSLMDIMHTTRIQQTPQ